MSNFALLVSACSFVCVVSASGKNPTPILFVDKTMFSEFDERLELRMNPPAKGPLVITPTEPWESWAVLGYNHVMQVAPRDYRLYYDCIEGSGVPPGTELGDTISHRRICLATSADGVNWKKPSLGIFNRNGSTANNILVEDSGVSVFIDSKPGVTSNERWKMVTSYSAYASRDGLHWTKLGTVKTDGADDTKPTAYYDALIGKYVIMVRHWVESLRMIGRCETTNLTDWVQSGGCQLVFGPDSQDPENFDLYTNAWTPYPSIEAPSVHLFFPSPYMHWSAQTPWGFGNDGLLDIRIAVSRNGKNFSYPDARNGRSPFVPLGINMCGSAASFPSVPGGWCSPTSGVEQRTTVDTSVLYMASGYLPSDDGTMIYFYSSGQPFTHGGDAGKDLWGNNSGIRVLSLRKDGFVSVDAPYGFPKDPEKLASFTTVPLQVPSDCAPPVINSSTSVRTSCGYEFPSGTCESPFTNIKCSSDSDCKQGFTCKGEQVTCDKGEGICRTASATGHTGDACISKTVANRTSGGVQLLLNLEMSVAGYALVEVQTQTGGSWEAAPGFTLQEADAARGSSLNAAASWGTGVMASLSRFAGETVKIRMAMADGKLFALRLACADGTVEEPTSIVV